MNPYPKSLQTGRGVITSDEYRKWQDTEASLQAKCEEYLQFFPNIGVVRIPDAAYRAIFANQQVSQWIKGLISKWLKGLPDLILIKSNGKGNVCLCVELKVGKGKMTQGQRKFADRVNVVEVRSFDYFQKLVEEFSRYDKV